MGTRRKLNIVIDAEYNGGREIESAADSIERVGLESEITARKQDLFDKKQKELSLSVTAGTKTIDKATKELEEYGNKLERGTSKTERASAAFQGMKSSIVPVGVAFAAVAVAAKQTQEIIGDGTKLIAAEEIFGNLAESIDTTADVLLGKMKAATNGMVSDAELIAAGTDIMNLGLADSEDGVIRLSAAVGALNLDMGVLALTLANDSTARLDSLGLSLEDVKKKKEELIASGFIGDAFDEAVLISLEEKMVLLGDASLTTAGQMAIVEAEAENLKNEAKALAAVMAGPVISGLSSAVTGQNKLNDGIAAGVVTTKEWNEIVNESASIQEGTADAIELVNRRLEEQATGISEAERTTIAYYEGMGVVTDATLEAGAAYETYTNALASAAIQEERFNESQAAGIEARSQAIESLSTLTSFVAGLDGTASGAASSMTSLASATIDQAFAAEVAAGALTPLEATIASINAQEGLGIVTSTEADILRDAAAEVGALNTIVGENAAAWAEAGTVTVEQGQLMAEKIELIGTTSLSTEENMRLMAVQGGENLTTLSSDYLDTSLSAETLKNESLQLKEAIDNIPDKKTVTIEIKTVGSIPQGLTEGGGNVSSTPGSVAAESTRVGGEMAR